jgi:hypothetical protein
MCYIHPREIDLEQPRLKLPLVKQLKYYFGLASTGPKLRSLFSTYRFGTVSKVLASVCLPHEYRLESGSDIVRVCTQGPGTRP